MNRLNLIYHPTTHNATLCGTCIDSSSTGKVKDSESGYHYFGARYYDCEALTGWLSVDPMSDKYPSLSPYNYCAGNPVKLMDPDGRDGDVVINEEDHSIGVTCNIYYLESDFDQPGAKNFITPYKNNSSLLSSAKAVFDEENVNTFDDVDGTEWTISIKVNYLLCKNQQELDAMLNNDPYANRMTYKEESPTGGGRGTYIQKLITISHSAATSPDGKTMAHEAGHAIGLLHPQYLLDGPFHGDSNNGRGDLSRIGGIMSYAENRQLNKYETANLGQRILSAAKQISPSLNGTYGLRACQPKDQEPYITLTKKF